MMQALNKVILTAVVLVLAGCSTPTKVDKGPITARTFQFVNTATKATPGYANTEKPIHALVQNAISTSMTKRGVARVADGGDVTVAYLILAGNNVSTGAINDHFGYGRDVEALQDKAHSKYADNKNPNYFEAGTLVIDIVDTKTWKILKRGYATRAIQRGATPEQQAARISEVVEEILRDTKFRT